LFILTLAFFIFCFIYFSFQSIICVILDSNLSNFLFSVYFVFALYSFDKKQVCT